MNQMNLFQAATTDYNVIAFAQREAHRMWPSMDHRVRSLRQIGRFVDFRDFASKPISHFLPADIAAFADHLVAEGSNPSTVNRYLASVSKVFNHAVDWQLINHAPKIKFMKEPEGRIRYFTDAEQSELIAYFRDEGLEWMADMVIVSLKTGARKGEVVALIEGEVAISDCGQWLMLTPEVTKTSKARNLPLNDVSRAAAQRLAGTGVYSKRKFEKAWAKAQRDVFRGDKSAVYHVCRHTAATTLVNDLAVPTVIVADILGHASLSTTARYAHSKPDALLDIASRM